MHAVRGGEPSGCSLQPRLVTGDQDEGVAIGGEAPGEGAADASGRAGDECGGHAVTLAQGSVPP